VSTVLILDEDEFLLALLNTVLVEEGFHTILTTSLDEALANLDDPQLAAIMLSADMHQPGSIAICRTFREKVPVPIFLMGSHGSATEELLAFAAGADDYLEKPFDPRVMLARLAHHISHNMPATPGVPGKGEPALTFQGIELDRSSRSAQVLGSRLHLTRTEFDLLALLMTKPHRVFTRREIVDHVWASGWYGDEHNLESHVSRLRRKIRDLGGPSVVVASRGVGYQLSDTTASSPHGSDAAPRSMEANRKHDVKE
jgi:DNA-binding response OmpR family regulator